MEAEISGQVKKKNTVPLKDIIGSHQSYVSMHLD